MGKSPGLEYKSPNSQSIAARIRVAPAAAKSVAPAPMPKVEAPKARKAVAAGASMPALAQASKTTSPRGRGIGRRFTKATAVGAAVARAQPLAPEQRQDIARRAASARWGRGAGS